MALGVSHTDCTKQNVVDRLGLYVQAYTLYSSVRPFGISTILGSVDQDGPGLYVVEPSGVFYVRSIFATHGFIIIDDKIGLQRCSCWKRQTVGKDRN